MRQRKKIRSVFARAGRCAVALALAVVFAVSSAEPGMAVTWADVNDLKSEAVSYTHLVLDLLPPELQKQKLFPVGRLDKDTEGLLLLTNQGSLAHDLLSPRHHVDKVYYTRVSGFLTEEGCAAFAAGMTLDDGLICLPAGLEILSAGEESEARVTLREGKFHQIKRMLAQRGKPVVYLERIAMGNLPLDLALERGKFRFLTAKEVELLQKA